MTARSALALGLSIGLAVAIPRSLRAQSEVLAGSGVFRGAETAPVTVVEFGDFGCPACALFARETFPAIEAEYVRAGQVRWQFIPFVLGPFRHAKYAARAALCAEAQNAFWPMHDALYARQDEWKDGDQHDTFAAIARGLGLEEDSFARCYTGRDVKDRVDAYSKLARRMRVRATPTFFVGEQRVLGALSAADFRQLLDRALQDASEPGGRR